MVEVERLLEIISIFTNNILQFSGSKINIEYSRHDNSLFFTVTYRYFELHLEYYFYTSDVIFTIYKNETRVIVKHDTLENSLYKINEILNGG